MSTSQKILLVAIIVISIALRLFFAWHHPFTNDEGAYLFDAKLLTEGKIPGGDVLTKAPAPALIFASSVWATDGSLFASRLVSVIASLLTTVPLAWIAYRLRGKTAATLAALLWLLAAAIPMQILGITQSIAGFLTATFLALWWEAVAPAKSFTIKQRWVAAFIAGVSLALAFASRKTSLAVVIPALYLWILADKKTRSQMLIQALMGILLVTLPWILITRRLYGLPGMSEAVGFGYGDIWHQEAESIAGKAGISWALAVLTRVGSGIGAAALIGLAWAIIKLCRNQLVPTLALIWILVLTGLYIGWPTFLPEYLIDFFIPIALLAALALADTWKRWPKWSAVAIGITLIASAASMWSAYKKPWTGMFTEEALKQAATELKERIPADQPIFTAAVIVPYLSGHDVIFNIVHPLWYRYAFILPSTKEAFLPPLEVVEQEIRGGEVDWALVEHLTDYAYLRHKSRLISLFRKEWQLVTTIPNDTGFRSNTLKLYQREGR